MEVSERKESARKKEEEETPMKIGIMERRSKKNISMSTGLMLVMDLSKLLKIKGVDNIREAPKKKYTGGVAFHMLIYGLYKRASIRTAKMDKAIENLLMPGSVINFPG